jgi:hypothetical protein
MAVKMQYQCSMSDGATGSHDNNEPALASQRRNNVSGVASKFVCITEL